MSNKYEILITFVKKGESMKIYEAESYAFTDYSTFYVYTRQLETGKQTHFYYPLRNILSIQIVIISD